MRNIIILLILLVPFSILAQKNKEVIINYKYIKDASVFYLSNQNTRFGKVNSIKCGGREFLDVLQWTWDGYVGQQKSVLFFDLSSVPANTSIVSAKLSLYKYQDRNNQYFSASKSQAFKIQKVKNNWKESEVTWNNKPSVVSVNQIIIPDNSDLMNIDISVFVREWLKNPKSNFGIMISCVESDYYRGLSFASTEYPDKKLRPKLTITYKIDLKKASALRYKPEKENKIIQNCNNNQTLIVYDNNFNLLYKEKGFSSDKLAEIIEGLDSGKYMFQLISNQIDIVIFQVIKK